MPHASPFSSTRLASPEFARRGSAPSRSRAPVAAFVRTAMLASLALMPVGLGCGSDDDDDGSQTATESLTPQEQANLDAVTTVLEQGLANGDTAVINQLVREDYIQHNAQAEDGRAGLLAFVQFLQSQGGTQVEFHRMLVDGDQVAVHVTYGSGQNRMVAFDVFRLEDGMLAEHWDALQPWVDASETVSGRTLVDGATEVTDRNKTEENRALVTEFVDVIFQQGQVDRLEEFIGDTYLQHNPNAPDGVEGLRAFIETAADQGLALGFTDSPLVVADGNFVLVGSEGYFGPAEEMPYAVFYDLFRVEDGQLVEHWDVIPDLPPLDSIPHDNGLF